MHWASTAAEVCRIVVDIVQRSAAREVVKAKTMVGEEVELNHALEAAGIRAIETDLGEFIIQLAGERPAHIVAPAIHKTREDVSDLFVEHIKAERTVVPEELTAIARRALREMFQKAGVGVSGANFAVAETGTVVTIENEGNIRMCTTVPRVHIALDRNRKAYSPARRPGNFSEIARPLRDGPKAHHLHFAPDRAAPRG